MARVLDVRNADGILVVLGNSIVLPTSDVAAEQLPGSIRFNPSSNGLEIFVSINGVAASWNKIPTGVEDNLNYLSVLGGTVSGNVTIDDNLTVGETVTASNVVSTSGEFINMLVSGTLSSYIFNATGTISAPVMTATSMIASTLSASEITATTISATGATWTTGTGAPTSSQPVGSMYSRVDGAAGSSFYISQAPGTWTAIA